MLTRCKNLLQQLEVFWGSFRLQPVGWSVSQWKHLYRLGQKTGPFL